MNRLAAICVAVLTAYSLPAIASSTSYYSQATFLGALSSTFTYNFDSTAAGTVIASGDTLDGATFSYALVPPGSPSILVDNNFATTSPNNYLGTDDGSGAFVGGDSFTITFDQTINAIGMYVISADVILPGDFTITTNTGQSVSSIDISDVTLIDGDAYFLGLIEDDPGMGFTSITLTSTVDAYLFNVDDISISAVPLPGAIWLLGSGLLLLTRIRRITSARPNH